MMSLGARLTRLRLKSNESLQQVADAVGVSKAHIWQLEKEKTDNPAIGLVTRLADHFKVSVAYLAGEDAEAEDADPALQRMFRQAKELDPGDRQVLDDMMRSLLARQKGKSD